MMAKFFRARAAELKEVGSGTGSEDAGKGQVNRRSMALQVREEVMFSMLSNVLEFRDDQLAMWRYLKDQ